MQEMISLDEKQKLKDEFDKYTIQSSVLKDQNRILHLPNQTIQFSSLKQFISEKPFRTTSPPIDMIFLNVADIELPIAANITQALQQCASLNTFCYEQPGQHYKESIKQWLLNRYNYDIACLDAILPNSQTLNGICGCINTFTKKNDPILINSPYYYMIKNSIEWCNRRVIFHELKKTKITKGPKQQIKFSFDIASFKQIIETSKPKMFILVSPHNPTAISLTKDQLQQIGSICLENKVLVVADEIYQDFVFAPQVHFPFGGISKQHAENCITLISPSKAFGLNSLSIGITIIENEELRQRYVKEQAKRGLYPDVIMNIFAKVSVIAAYSNSNNDGSLEWLSAVKEYVWQNYILLQESLDNRIMVAEMQATFLVLLDMSTCLEQHKHIKSLEQLHLAILQLGVSSNMGSDFGIENALRLNIAVPKNVLLKAIEIINQVVDLEYFNTTTI